MVTYGGLAEVCKSVRALYKILGLYRVTSRVGVSGRAGRRGYEQLITNDGWGHSA